MTGGSRGWWGPNGSGKSNLSDAIRWVLGETSSRQLRSAGKMEDVIFGGTRRRGAMGYASVRLTWTNAGHALDLDAAEVTIGRRYYRSGESEYTINGQACRLKDVYELLLDTGIGRDGYSIIGRAASPRSWPPGQRAAEIFEDACGIAKYRYRRTEAEHRLAAAQLTSSACGTSWPSWKAGWPPWPKRPKRPRAYLDLAAPVRKGWKSHLWVRTSGRPAPAMQQLQRTMRRPSRL